MKRETASLMWKSGQPPEGGSLRRPRERGLKKEGRGCGATQGFGKKRNCPDKKGKGKIKKKEGKNIRTEELKKPDGKNGSKTFGRQAAK